MIRAVLLGLRAVVFDREAARRLYASGYYGKPLGIPKPRGSNFDAPLELGLLETLHLLERGMLEVYDEEGHRVSVEEVRRRAERFIPKFELLYKVYRDLRDRGYVVRSGLKYGSDFAVYERGPGLEHAPYLVHVMRVDEEIDPLEIVRAGRLSHSVRKAFILALTGPRDTPIRYLLLKWSKP
ncbi:tRNA-intron lyase [Hyperthermus butylicus]|uniref:tRNA-splicing endonuclease n=1 Tax=Hyperthermus butylicus (strain DSM 5456 / JCM 9403 / PLM1-5) TaxID=415426 RepID=ENDA_HYPBU|nr:tRNA-intron lyase [Hyperthermus butylicus]A2BIW2.1 RecName: Full=tRNA-splicing endonuclease; AltName: Full=tRNA-intron endonuclease [Hyperthermus butylicus DSM 5456]ABM79923.1 General archaeal splicing enzyme [Hyperthermus butylicus DSM 5456]